MKLINLLIISFFIVSCSQNKDKNVTDKIKTDERVIVDQNIVNKNIKAEVYYFHGTRRCPTCVAVGEISKAAVENNFKKEIAEGIIAFYDINVEVDSNKALAEKYQITWNALIIKTYDEKGEHLEDLTDFAFQYARNDPDELESAIKSRLYKILNQ